MAIVATLKTFKGGHYFSRFEGTPKGRITSVPLPKEVHVPLRQGYGEEAAPLVEVGAQVKTGEIIARSDGAISTPVHAPISGEVVGIEERPHPVDGGLTTFVTIRSDGRDEWQPLDVPKGNFERWGAEELGRILYESGVSALGKAGFPTPLRSSAAEPHEIRYLLINAVETEPYLQGDLALLHEEFEKFLTGTKILKGALGNIEVHVGLSHDRPHLLEELENRMEYHDWLFLHPLLPKYPQGTDEVLIKTLLDLEVPSGEPATAIGVVVCDTQQVIAAYEAVVEGKPLVERVISVGGSAVERPANVRVRVGTPVGELLKGFGHKTPSRVILGGPMRGRSVSDVEAPILRDIRALIALREPAGRLLGGIRPGLPFFRREKRATTGLNGAPRPCIHCGYCLDVCPQNLFPIWLAEAAQEGDLKQMEALDLFACIECGLCSYVCPSKIPIMERIQQGKRLTCEERLEE
jgi:electron transport complex protein RnfC